VTDAQGTGVACLMHVVRSGHTAAPLSAQEAA